MAVDQKPTASGMPHGIIVHLLLLDRVMQIQVARAKQAHEHYVQRVLRFMAEYDLLCCPCVMLPPFDVDIR